jgi:hypothetical protein
MNALVPWARTCFCSLSHADPQPCQPQSARRMKPRLPNVRHRPDERNPAWKTFPALTGQRVERSQHAPERSSLQRSQSGGALLGAALSAARRRTRPGTHTDSWLHALPKGLRPVRLQQDFPRIANDLARLWAKTEELDRYFDDKEFSPRDDRSGFPPLVKEELLALHLYSLRTRLASYVTGKQPASLPFRSFRASPSAAAARRSAASTAVA